ncbi:MAG: lipoprotein [Alphaproteobacteria bacterium]
MRALAMALVAVFALSVVLGACGKKGSLDPPPGKKSEYPRTYPR